MEGEIFGFGKKNCGFKNIRKRADGALVVNEETSACDRRMQTQSQDCRLQNPVLAYSLMKTLTISGNAAMIKSGNALLNFTISEACNLTCFFFFLFV